MIIIFKSDSVKSNGNSNQKIIELFKTNLPGEDAVFFVKNKIAETYPNAVINVDLEDTDKVMKLKNETVDRAFVIETLTSMGYLCEVLD